MSLNDVGTSSNAVLPGTSSSRMVPGHRLAGKVALITGAARGIGRTMANRFSDEGACVVIADIDAEFGQAAAAEIIARGGKSLFCQVDITNEENVRSLVANVLSECSRLDILVNNAGIGLNKPFLETTLEEWDRLIAVVLTGTFLCSQAAAREMARCGCGTIINIASISGQRGAQGRAAYGSAKAAVIQLTKVMAVELASQGVRVNAISPGPVVTDQSNGTHTIATRKSYFDRIPMHRYGERHEVAGAALFLASDESTFIHGHVLNVDGGFQAAGLMFDPNAD